MMMGKCCKVHAVAYWLMWIGAINWGLIGFFNFDLVNAIFGTWPIVVRVIYALVGLAAVAMLFKGSCKMCKMEESGKKM